MINTLFMIFAIVIVFPLIIYIFRDSIGRFMAWSCGKNIVQAIDAVVKILQEDVDKATRKRNQEHIEYWVEQRQNLKKMMQWQKDNAPSAEDQARYYEYQKSKLSPEDFERWVNRQIEAQLHIDKFLKE